MSDAQMVFALRRSGELDQALEEARSLMEQQPNDPWSVKALGWTLYSLVKKAMQSGELEKARAWQQELAALSVDDELLVAKRDYLQEKLSPEQELLSKVRELEQSGNKDEALQVCREMLKKYPDSEAVATKTGWLLVSALKELTKQETKDSAAVQQILREYATLKVCHKASPLHSMILRHATVLWENVASYLKFLQWWNLDNLRPEDQEQFTSKETGKTFNSLVERVIAASYRAAMAGAKKEDAKWVLDLMDKFAGPYESRQEWYGYYRALLLLALGRKEEARAKLLPVARVKHREYWIWEKLAKTYEDSSDEQLACLCKAMLYKVNGKEKLVNVHEELGNVLLAHGYKPAAKREFLSALNIRLQQEWKVSEDLRKLVDDVCKDVEATSNNTALYKEKAALTDSLLGFKKEKEVTGVVVFIDEKRGFTQVAFGKKEYARIHHDKFPEAGNLSPGAFLRLNLKTSNNMHPMVVGFKKTDEQPSAEFCKEIRGKLRLPREGRFGFVDDVYVPEAMLAKGKFQPEQHVACLAVCSWFARKNEFTWSAVAWL